MDTQPTPIRDNTSLFNYSNPATTTKFHPTTAKVKKTITPKQQQHDTTHQATAYKTQTE